MNRERTVPSFRKVTVHRPYSLPSAAGDDVSLDEFTNRKPVLLYFSMEPG
jgi:hypothetical protein